ncbi:MAG: type VII secretion target [Anaerolineae bacterium]|jgi:hypothetical protein
MADVHMDVDAVKKMADQFYSVGEKAEQISKAMGTTIAVLKAAAFTGAVGAAAHAEYLETLKPMVDRYAGKCAELSADLESAIRSYEHGDALGATRFH